MNQTWESGKKKTLILGLILVRFGPDSGRQIFFQKSGSVMISYHHVQYQKKLMIKSWENLWQTDGRQTDKSDFRGRCRINVERPKIDQMEQCI